MYDTTVLYPVSEACTTYTFLGQGMYRAVSERVCLGSVQQQAWVGFLGSGLGVPGVLPTTP